MREMDIFRRRVVGGLTSLLILALVVIEIFYFGSESSKSAGLHCPNVVLSVPYAWFLVSFINKVFMTIRIAFFRLMLPQSLCIFLSWLLLVIFLGQP